VFYRVKNLPPASLVAPHDVFVSARLSGKDREAFAQRLLSRDIKKLAPQSPSLCLLLAADAKVVSFFWIERQSDALRLYGMKNELDSLREKLELYRFTEEVLWENEGGVKAQFEEVGEDGWTPLKISFHPQSSHPSMSEAEWLQMRIQKLLPLRDWDFDQTQNVFELGLTGACDENKGCYIGQEVVERVRSRGGRATRHLASAQFKSEIQASEGLCVETEKVGKLTKSVVSATTGYQALSWIERRFCQIGTKVRAETSNHIGVITKVLESPNTSAPKES